jgi:hypothetical protein
MRAGFVARPSMSKRIEATGKDVAEIAAEIGTAHWYLCAILGGYRVGKYMRKNLSRYFAVPEQDLFVEVE